MARLINEATNLKVIDLYSNHKLPKRIVAKILGIGSTSVARLLTNEGQKLRSPREAMKLAHREHRAYVPTGPKSESHKANLATAQVQYLSSHEHQFKGRCHSEETKNQMRNNLEHHKHVSQSTRGKPKSDEHKKNVSAKVKKAYEEGRLINPMNPNHPKYRQAIEKIKIARHLNWQDPNYRERVLPACLKSRRPTGIERKVIGIIEKHSLPFKYTGNGSFIICGLNPDFVNINGEKVAIDVFGDHWHAIDGVNSRKAIFAEYGWKLVVIWEREINSLSEQEILHKIML